MLQQLFNQASDRLPAGLEKNIRALIQASLSKLNLVSREEFDAQAAILARTRSKVDQLERELAELEQAIEQLQRPQ